MAWRYANYDTPFWSRANTRDGRWHRAGKVAAQYLSLEPNGAWAELIRAEDLHTDQEVDYVRMPLWVISLTQGMLVDYSTFDLADDAGFPPDALIDDDWNRCQEEGERLRREGFAGVIAPSAALPGSTNVTIFGPRISASWGSSSSFSSAIPATVAAVGAPPPKLRERVRMFGQAHEDYDEYRRIQAVARNARPKPATGTSTSPDSEG